MMVHEALKRHLLNSQKELFLDFEESPLSVHNLCKHSKKPAGEYLGPQQAAYAMQNALHENPIDAFEFLVFPDSCLYLDEVLKHLN